MARLIVIDFSIKSREHHDRALRAFLLLNIVLDAIVLTCHEYLITTDRTDLSQGGWIIHLLLAFHILLAVTAATSFSPTFAMEIIFQKISNAHGIDGEVLCDGMPLSVLDWACLSGGLVLGAVFVDVIVGALSWPESALLSGAASIIGMVYLAHLWSIIGLFGLTWVQNGWQLEKE